MPEGVIELEDAAAFGNVVHGKGLISICGFGSLLSGKDAQLSTELLGVELSEQSRVVHSANLCDCDTLL